MEEIIHLASQKNAFKKLNKVHSYKVFFLNEKDQTEFCSYWKKYCKKMIEAQDSAFLKKTRKYFKKIYLEEKDDAFAKNFSIQKINEVKGYGLFAKEDLQKGEVFTHYAGIMRKDNQQISKKNRYVFGFTGTEKLKEWTIDASKVCNIASLMNHSETPNVDSYEYYDFEGPNIVFEALRNISKGEELTYDYGKEYWEGFGETPQ